MGLYGSGYPGGKVFNRAAFTAPRAGPHGILGAQCVAGLWNPQADKRRFRTQIARGSTNIFSATAKTIEKSLLIELCQNRGKKPIP
jgi:hypothetical protein